MRLAGDDAKAADRYWTCSTFQISKSGAIFSKNAGASSYACVFTSSAPPQGGLHRSDTSIPSTR